MYTLRNGQYIGQVLPASEYIPWKSGDKILISGSPNTGKTRFAIDYATYMYREHKLESLFITSRGLVRRQLNNQYGNLAHDFISFQSYHSFLDRGKISQLESYDIIIVDESAVFFDDAFIPSLGDKADRLLNHLINNCQKPIVIFMSALGEWLSSYIEKYYNSNDDTSNPNHDMLNPLFRPIKLIKYKFTKPLNYSNWFMLGDNDIDDLLDNIPDDDKVIYFCSENECKKVHEKIWQKTHAKIVSSLKVQHQKITVAMNKEARKLAKQSIALFNAKGFNLYKETLGKSNKRDIYHETFDEIITSKRFNAKILVASVGVSTDISITDSCIKHVVIDVYDHSQIYRIAGRLKSGSDNVSIYFRIRNNNYSHIRILLKRRDVIKHLMSSNVSTMEALVTNFNIEDLQGLVRMEDANKPTQHNDYAVFPCIKRILLKPIFSAHHKVELDIDSYFKTKDNEPDHLLFKYEMVGEEMHTSILKYVPASQRVSIDWLRATLTKFARDGTVLFDEDIKEQIKEHIAIASGEKRRKRRLEINKDLELLNIRVKIADIRKRVKDESGKNAINQATGKHISHRGWQFILRADDV